MPIKRKQTEHPVVSRIIPFLITPNNVHIIISEPVNLVPFIAKGLYSSDCFPELSR